MSDTPDNKKTSSEEEESLVVPTDEDGNENTNATVKKLQERLKKCIGEKDEFLAGWQRAKADLINARREDEQRNAKTAEFARENLIIELLPVLDSFELAFANKEAWEQAPKNWREGIEYIYKTYMSTLKNHGLETLEPLGERFNPNLHEGVSTIPAREESEDGLITRVLRKGYMINRKMIRPAHVEYKEYKKHDS